MKKYFNLILLIPFLFILSCSKDDSTPVSPTPTYKIEGSWNITIYGANSLTGILNILTATSSNFNGTISFTGKGQINTSGTLTSTQIHFSFKSQETSFIARWEMDGTYDLPNGKMSGTVTVYNDNTNIKQYDFSWDAKK